MTHSPALPNLLPNARLRELLDDHLRAAHELEARLDDVEAVARLVTNAFAAGGKLLAFGNGGSAADAQHLCAEFTGRFRRERRPLPAVALTTDSSALTCIGNDYSFEQVFARQALALASPGDVALGFSTSGRSRNVVRGLEASRERGAATVAFTGSDPGVVGAAADLVLSVPSSATARVQELHILCVHLVCERIDDWALEGSALEGSA